MGSVTQVDFSVRRREAAAPLKAADVEAWADQVAVWRFSPIVRLLAAAAAFGVIMTGLAMVAVCAAAVLGRLA